MRQAIVTKYIGPTNVRGSRVKATADAGSLTLGWDHALDSEANHHRAARALAEKYGWSGDWVGGGLPRNAGGNCYVNVPTYSDSCKFSIPEPMPTLGPCACKRGTSRDNCPNCEGTGNAIDWPTYHRRKAERESVKVKS